MTQANDSWFSPVLAAIDANARSGGYVVAMSDYRPVLIQVVADKCGLMLRDFRAEILRPKGWEAFATPLSALDEFIVEGGGMIMNAEALLSTKSSDERTAWLSRFSSSAGPLAVVPLVVFANDVPPSPRKVVLDPATLPEETLLTRLMEM